MKAVVVKIKGNNAALLLDDGQFIMTRNHDYTIGEEINNIKKSSYQTRFLTLAASAAVFVIILTASVFAFVTPAYYISVDVNPSLVMEVNIFERLIAMEAMNDDAEMIMDGLDWKYKDVDDVLNMAFQRIAQEGKLKNGGSILITAAGKSEARTAVMIAEIKEKADTLYPQDVSVQTETVGIDMVTAAKEFGLTPGKYNLITKLLGETVTNENKALSVQELMAKFTAAKASISEEKANDAKQNNGSAIRPAEAEAGRQKADQMVSEASQKKPEAIESASQEVSEAARQTAEAAKAVTETLPIATNRSPAQTVAESDNEITHPPVETPTDTLVDGPDVPDVPEVPNVPDVSDIPEIPDVPASTAEPNIPAANDNRP